MNKKFFTLIVGLLLAVCGTANAQTVADPTTSYQQDGYYMLGNGTDFISVYADLTNGIYEYQIVSATQATSSFKNLAAALWKVNIIKPAGSPDVKYVYTNRLTGVVLSADAMGAYSATKPIPAAGALTASMPMGGNVTEWNNTSTTAITDSVPMSFYFNNTGIASRDSVVYLVAADGTPAAPLLGTKVLVAYKEPVATPQTYAANAFKIEPYGVNYICLRADDLNSELWSDPALTSFQASFNPTVSTGFLNQFTDTRLIAENVSGSPLYGCNYVTLQVPGSDKYVVVDTAYHVGTEQVGQLVKVTTDKLSADRRNPGSYNFAFQYHPANDSISIQVQSFYRKQPVQDAVAASTTLDSYWWAGAVGTATPEVTDGAVRVAILYGTQVLTFANRTDGTTLPAGVNFFGEVDQNTMVRIGKGVVGPNYTTLANGIYLIRYNTTSKTGTNKRNNGDFLLKNLAGLSGWKAAEDVREFHNMPAAQWVVTQNNPGTPYSAITITNREFNDITNGNVTGATSATDPKQYTAFPRGAQLYSIAGSNNVVMRYSSNGVSVIDTLTFIPVRDQKTKTIGYKYVEQDSVLVEKYFFTYFNALVKGKNLSVKSAKDSAVFVDPNEGKVTFQLEYAAQDDYYGFDSLKRNAYYIRVKDATKLHYENHCLVYDNVRNQYIVSPNKRQAFFLKENNYVDGTSYYTLVEANVLDSVVVGGIQTATTGYSDSKGNIYAAGAAMPVYRDVTVNGKTTGRASGIVVDNVTSVNVLNGLYVYYNNNGTVTKVYLNNYLTGVGAIPANVKWTNFARISTQYSDQFKASVTDDEAKLTRGSWDNLFNGSSEERTSAFAVTIDDAPLYRRFNANANGKETGETFGDAANSPLYLKFNKFNNRDQYLGENSPATATENGVGRYRFGLNNKSISFLGLFNKSQYNETAKMAYTMFVDTAYVRNNTIMPQYLIGIRESVQKADTVWCQDPNHTTRQDSLNCYHTKITQAFTRAMWLFNANDSARNAGNVDYLGKKEYACDDEVRLAFVDGIHARDTFYVLRGANSLLKNEEINLDRMVFAAGDKIALNNNLHKNVVFSFRLIDDANRRFLMESYSGRLNNKRHDATTNEGIAPRNGGWVMIKNGVPVMTYSDLNTAVALAEIFDVETGTEKGAVANENVATTEVQVIAVDGGVIVKNAAGKRVVISNILGQTIANATLTSDSQTISAPQGVAIVAVEGEKAVKAMVK